MDGWFARVACFGMVVGSLASCSDPVKLRRGDDTDDLGGPTGPSKRELGQHPIVEVVGDRVTLDGDAAGAPGAQRTHRVEELFSALSKRKEATDQVLPNRSKGVCGLRVSRDLPLPSFMSVFQTIGDAGYHGISVQLIESPESILDFTAMDTDPTSERIPMTPEPILRVYAAGPAPALVWTQGSGVLTEAVRAEVTDLGNAVCHEWKERGSHRAPADDNKDLAVLHLSDAGTVDDAKRLTNLIVGCTRELAAIDGGAPRRQPAFEVVLAPW